MVPTFQLSKNSHWNIQIHPYCWSVLTQVPWSPDMTNVMFVCMCEICCKMFVIVTKPFATEWNKNISQLISCMCTNLSVFPLLPWNRFPGHFRQLQYDRRVCQVFQDMWEARYCYNKAKNKDQIFFKQFLHVGASGHLSQYRQAVWRWRLLRV